MLGVVGGHRHADADMLCIEGDASCMAVARSSLAKRLAIGGMIKAKTSSTLLAVAFYRWKVQLVHSRSDEGEEGYSQGGGHVETEDMCCLGDYLYSHPWILDDAAALSNSKSYWNLEDASFEYMVAEVREAVSLRRLH